MQVVIPIVIGITIYIFFREPTKYLLNEWFKDSYLNINYSVFAKYSPSWIKYNLTDALWGYAFVSSMIIIWGKKEKNELFIWIICSILIGALLEFLQLFKIIAGTFDVLDLVFVIFGMSLSIYINYFRKRKLI